MNDTFQQLPNQWFQAIEKDDGRGLVALVRKGARAEWTERYQRAALLMAAAEEKSNALRALLEDLGPVCRRWAASTRTSSTRPRDPAIIVCCNFAWIR